MRWTAGLLLLLFAPLLCAQEQEQEADLAAAVDQPTARERRKAALALAKRNEVTLDTWIRIMGAFAPSGRTEPGFGRVTVPLVVEGKLEQTEISFYVPESYKPEKPVPLLLTLHGTGGDGRQGPSRWRETADAVGMVVVSPRETVPRGGYGYTQRERGSVMAVLRWARRAFNIDENRIHLTGISRGGHLTWDLGLRHPDRWASLSPMIGGPRLDTRRGQNNLRFLENAVRMPIRDLQGEGDDPRLLFNLRLAFRTLKQLHAPDFKLITFADLGHSFRMEAIDWKTFLGGVRRKPDAETVVRMCADVREGRALWIEILRVDRKIKESFMPRVEASVWNALDDAGKRIFLVKEAVKRTARLEVVRKRRGEFQARGRGIRRFRLLLARGMFDPKEPVRIVWKGKTRTVHPRPSRKVLLLDFVERFDRTLLPVVAVTVP